MMPSGCERITQGVADCGNCGVRFRFYPVSAAAKIADKPHKAIETVVVTICPACHSRDINPYKTLGMVRYCKCRVCGENFKDIKDA